MTGAKRRAAVTRAPGTKVLVLGLGVLLWAAAMVAPGTGPQETSGVMVQNKVVEHLVVQTEAEAENQARAAAGLALRCRYACRIS